MTDTDPPITFVHIQPPPPWPTGLACGVLTWIGMTGRHMQDAGIDCDVADAFPPRGVIVTHVQALPRRVVQSPDQVIVNCLGDRAYKRWTGSVVVHQSPHQLVDPRIEERLKRSVPDTHHCYIPHWPQPGLIPRDPARGDRFDTVAYIGHPNEIDPAMRDPAFAAGLRELGIEWRIIDDSAQWHDYHDLDALIALRARPGLVTHKPATKLFNAWLAGVIPLLGPEAAFRYEGRPGVDYIEIGTPQEAIDAIRALRCDPDRRRRLVAARPLHDADVVVGRIRDAWREMLVDHAIPAWHRWRARSRLGRGAVRMRAWATFRVAAQIDAARRRLNAGRKPSVVPPLNADAPG
jgi:hypothetical protein